MPDMDDKAGSANDKIGGKKAKGIGKYKWWVVGGLAIIAVLVFVFVKKSNTPQATSGTQGVGGAGGYRGGGRPGPAGPRGPRGGRGPRGPRGGGWRNRRILGADQAPDSGAVGSEPLIMREASITHAGSQLRHFNTSNVPEMLW